MLQFAVSQFSPGVSHRIDNCTAFNKHIYVKDGPYWAVRGDFDKAVKDTNGEKIEWMLFGGEQVVRIVTVID